MQTNNLEGNKYFWLFSIFCGKLDYNFTFKSITNAYKIEISHSVFPSENCHKMNKEKFSCSLIWSLHNRALYPLSRKTPLTFTNASQKYFSISFHRNFCAASFSRLAMYDTSFRITRVEERIILSFFHSSCCCSLFTENEKLNYFEYEN